MTPTTDLTAFEHEAMSVSQALEQANYHLNQMGRILVIGEISQLTARNHWYFTLKDPQSVISCIMFPDIGLHDILCIFTIQRILSSPEVSLKREIHPVIIK